MIAGLPWTAWVLIALSIGPALLLALLFYRAHGGEIDVAPGVGAGDAARKGR